MEPPYMRMSNKDLLLRDLERAQNTEVIAIIYNQLNEENKK